MSIFNILRRLLLPVFARVNAGDITIRHQHTGDRFRLHSFRHRSYWFYGKRREAETMDAFSRIIRDGDVVLDVGGHIGYVALFFARLVGPAGRVFVFEPGLNNLPYLRQNVNGKPTITLVEKAVGDCNGRGAFYLESLGGQNNSCVKDYACVEANSTAAGLQAFARVEPVMVDMVTLDSFCLSEGVLPTFIKIDVEGYELEALRGALSVIEKAHPVLMVEIMSPCDDTLHLLQGLGYTAFCASPGHRRLTTVLRPPANFFFLDARFHEGHIQQLRQDELLE